MPSEAWLRQISVRKYKYNRTFCQYLTTSTKKYKCLFLESDHKNALGTVYKPRRQRRGEGGCQNVHVCLRGGGSRVCLRRQNTYQFQRILIVKYQFLQGLFIFHIFTIKICGMVNETTIPTYEIVNLRTILIFVGKNYFSETKGGGT